MDNEIENHQISLVSIYSNVAHIVMTAGRKLGWAIAIHGSLKKDLDLIAVPWTEDCCSVADLVKVVVRETGGNLQEGFCYKGGSWIKGDNPGKKPHGRLSYTILLGGNGAYIDLAVMPKVDNSF